MAEKKKVQGATAAITVSQTKVTLRGRGLPPGAVCGAILWFHDRKSRGEKTTPNVDRGQIGDGTSAMQCIADGDGNVVIPVPRMMLLGPPGVIKGRCYGAISTDGYLLDAGPVEVDLTK